MLIIITYFFILNYFFDEKQIEMLGWSGMDVSPDKDASIEKIQLKKGSDLTSPNDGALVNGKIIFLL